MRRKVSATSERSRGLLRPAAAQGRLDFFWYPAADDLADVVERHWSVRWDLRGQEPFVQDVLPHPGANLCFEPGGATAHGIVTRRASHRLEGAGDTVGTAFRPGAFAGFTPVAMADLVDRAASLAEVFGPDGTALERRVAGSVGDTARIGIVEAFLRARRPPRDPAAEEVGRMVAWMLAAPARTRVADVAREHGRSPRALQRLFRRYVGVGPKWVLQRYRLHAAAERIATGGSPDWGSSWPNWATPTRRTSSGTSAPPSASRRGSSRRAAVGRDGRRPATGAKRVTGIEPVSPPWEGGVLPMDHTRGSAPEDTDRDYPVLKHVAPYVLARDLGSRGARGAPGLRRRLARA